MFVVRALSCIIDIGYCMLYILMGTIDFRYGIVMLVEIA